MSVERERGRRAEAAARMLRCRRRAGEDGPQEEEAVEQPAELAEVEVEVEAVVHRRQRRRTVSQGMVAVSVLSSGEVGRWSAAVGGLAGHGDAAVRTLSAQIVRVWEQQVDEARKAEAQKHKRGPKPSGTGASTCPACRGAHRAHTCKKR